ncbi:CDP-diacylglycerol--glycerol-3-phosphate 3-phosphatidyltransferase [Lysinibacter sp. HNR]|uniref:CDP-diacylglycerol--glycerol-3-phosphate 3-phosphatidyltransferase n=1 Tax=Lysinibacter sp. HNR TaxID=3031408 RepID=UPI002435E965|nr:CDP-diacylglycerol--glycerol-3-phosphate 3-phosphatidyltransferase [Lysinibacter sp. HNR]WGD38273.1 CDP-diacylglycerol--glycerol-3-phosphate 3-phosphatidyltransferase [Lysinibacter sp. HNR]
MSAEVQSSGSHPSNWNAPNTITVARILLTPLCVWLVLAGGGSPDASRWWGAALFIIAISTDWVDGFLARRNNQVTDLGKLLDPIADKLLTGAALVCLSILAELPWWVTVIILIREWGITVDRLIRAGGHVVIAAAWLGKIKTFMQAIAISLALLPLASVWGSWVEPINTVTMSLACALTILSGLDYVRTALGSTKPARG